ncbi:uncharacterized protein LOC128769607 isoform X1 [Synchiropus splendidus]|uniref:uncharacterized protein LOC128769607 isoform X1 n=2 Tax=Synchiropus splendidus TaxID=270530 RepID=UPI00237DCC26|nr:uncharacterized protein LOC128769607 isoform X1 [Synchiropus splendidus]
MNMKRFGVGPPVVAQPPAHLARADQRGNVRATENRDEQLLLASLKRVAGPGSRTPHIPPAANPDMTHTVQESGIKKWKSSFKPLDGEEQSAEDSPGQTAHGSPATLRAPEDQNMNHIDKSSESYEHSSPVCDPEPEKPKKRLNKWRSMFKSLDEQIASAEAANSTGNRNKTELYDPFDLHHSDSDPESPEQKRFPLDQVYRGCLSPAQSHNSNSWDSGRPHQRNDSVPDGSRFKDPWSSSPPAASERQELRSLSPDQTISRSYPERLTYKEERREEEEELNTPKYRSEIATRVRLSPPRLKEDYQQFTAHKMRGVDRLSPSTVETKIRKRSIIMDKNPINCELCDIELASGPELENHLDSKTHWDTMEFIQKENHFDDLVIAFLQEVMLNKCSKCSPDVDPRAIQTLQEKDHMTKVEIFHCAACRVFVSTSVASVQKHITSEEHLFNTQDSEVDRRQACLEKADSMLKQLKPELEVFLKVLNFTNCTLYRS